LKAVCRSFKYNPEFAFAVLTWHTHEASEIWGAAAAGTGTTGESYTTYHAKQMDCQLNPDDSMDDGATLKASGAVSYCRTNQKKTQFIMSADDEAWESYDLGHTVRQERLELGER